MDDQTRKKVGVTPERKARLRKLRRQVEDTLDGIMARNPNYETRHDALEPFITQMLRVASFNGLRSWQTTSQGKRTAVQGARDSLTRFLGGAACYAWVEHLIRLTVEDFEKKVTPEPLSSAIPDSPLRDGSEGESMIGGTHRREALARLTIHPQNDTAEGVTLGDQIVLAHFKGDAEAVLQLARQVDARLEGR